MDGEEDIERWDLERLVWHRVLTLLLVGLPVCRSAGLLVCLVAGGLAVRHRRTPYPWIGLALVFPENADDGLVVSARTLDYGGLTIHTTHGYDNVTGVGSPSGLSFLKLL